ncbi:glycine zipper 2TM domain-containing protein [Janthinobacterium fluminis]|uniref:Glycine zipper 2TM domain-containing protein n=1 Tax=Janthinobacterium fluminis TaxID=2987524 RepID=A0ABT5K4X6_9BURK|nr:glycine zipper 2TM domain-containing protein [Janthinobacterium fluminis]MDC8760051.1 glycine zipper 2TM domain-containing protein [Janthinobacterium fluminis]
MHTPNDPTARAPLHPLMKAAAVAVLLFCGVGTAAVMGWLPSSVGGNHSPGALTPKEQTAALAQDEAPGTPNAARAAAPQARPAPQASVCANCGVVESVREITTRAEGSGVGAAGGAVLGGLLGNQVGGGHGRQLATVAGAIGGAVAGNQIEGNMNARRSYDVKVRLDNGNTRTIHQTAQPGWRAGDQVRIVNGVIHGNG